MNQDVLDQDRAQTLVRENMPEMTSPKLTVDDLARRIGDCAVLLDIDGTLLDLAPTPREVWVPPGLAKTLSQLHAKTSGALALVSGRSLNDIDLIFAPEQFPAVGGHGAEMRVSIDSESVAVHAPPMDKELKRRLAAIAKLSPGILLALSGYLFAIGVLSAQTQTIAWMVIFFCASPAASAAYLTVSETFPLEVRALAIAFFYAVGTGIGGVAGPALFGALIDTGSRDSVFFGYLLGAGLMIAAAVVAWRYAIAAERRTLESVARPLAFVE